MMELENYSLECCSLEEFQKEQTNCQTSGTLKEAYKNYKDAEQLYLELKKIETGV